MFTLVISPTSAIKKNILIFFLNASQPLHAKHLDIVYV